MDVLCDIRLIFTYALDGIIGVDYDEDMEYIMSNPIDKHNFNIAVQKLKDNMNVLSHYDNKQTLVLTNGKTIIIGLEY